MQYRWQTPWRVLETLLHRELSSFRGHPNKVQDQYCILGLILTYYIDSMRYRSLSMMFDILQSTFRRYLNNAAKSLWKTLKSSTEPDLNAICWISGVNGPRNGRKKTLLLREGKVSSIAATMSFCDVQNAMVSRFLRVTLITSIVIVIISFGADCCIVRGKNSTVGSWNDAETSRELQLMLTELDKVFFDIE